ncbi:lysylphosphatidylglycerol synthase domain-containing protein [Xylophilus ampelinus]|uniref:Lysylphosphatidylglycerol synthase-like protein n=1 Tax=Xylophilus ampelinus TaxID=54067 RepID=A0A318SHM6_9BURK|nr:lysylphosphatidylglycerol synthase domain-containing protein [Xylophilus ampelinus]MCS4510016.1 lysylphosphatidylglycerol synthase domain-containing protein [Xylophilus ampelinus]PYE78404.1 hypothetical protein DFQ15_10754 [Xylophilus ampelinus]
MATPCAPASVAPAPLPVPAASAHWFIRLRARPWWTWSVRLLGIAFLLLVAFLLIRQARTVDWPAVFRSMKALPLQVLAAGAAFAAASHLLYSTFDLIGRHFSGHTLSVPRTMGITLISYPFTLNLGSLVGGVAVRLRLYSRNGVDTGQIGQIIGTSIVTNWVGYFLLAGAVFRLFTPALPEGWSIAPGQLHAIGIGLGAITVAYLLLCLWRRGRPLALRGRTFVLPGPAFSLVQVAMSAGNWMLMSGAVWVLLQQQVAYPAVLGTMLFGAVAGLVSRVPAGLGVLEAVAVAVLADYAPKDQILAAVLAYRALYYFAPLVLAALAFGTVEWLRRGEENSDGAPVADIGTPRR